MEDTKPIGRPSSYTPEIGDRIAAEISAGLSLRTIAKGEGMPSIQTMFNWMRTQPAFLEQYTRAKQEQADAMAEEMLDIADDSTNDWMERLDQDGKPIGYILNGDHVQRSRLRIETRKWLASKLKPKKWGEKQAVELTGADGGPVEIATVKVVIGE